MPEPAPPTSTSASPAGSGHLGRSTRMPAAVYALTAGTFLMGTTEFVVAGLLPQMATDYATTVARAGLAITVFAVGMVIGAPAMALLTLRLPRRATLALALGVFAAGHVAVATTDDVTVLLAARLVTAVATGAFWAVGSVVAAQAAAPGASGRALGLVLGGGMLANVLGVPLGSFSGQLIGWRGTFWALAVLAVLAAVAVLRLVPSDHSDSAAPSVRAELAVLGDQRLWLVLATCTLITAGVLSVYSYITPLLERAGLPPAAIPPALLAFGAGALAGNITGGRLGDTRPYTTCLALTGATALVMVGLWAASAHPVPLLVLFALLGLVGLSANPVLVSLAVHLGGRAPTLAAAMPTSLFNLGTAVGTATTSVLLGTGLRASAPVAVGTLAAVLVLMPLITLARLETRTAPDRGDLQPTPAPDAG